jgi:L-asparaginase
VTHHVDADPVLFEAAVGAGAQGVVLVGTGAGNATPQFVRAVARAVEAEVLVALSTRVAAGPVAPLYTGGGAVDLAEAGAVLTGTLRAGQARIAVLAGLLSATGPAEQTAQLRRIVAAAPALETAAL